MKTMYVAFMLALVSFTKIHTIFDLSPWLIIENKTPFEVSCLITAIHQLGDNENQEITILTDINNNLSVTYQTIKIDEKDHMLFHINLICNPYETRIINPFFAEKKLVFNPDITDVLFTQQALQLSMAATPYQHNDRHATLEYNDHTGITAKIKSISLFAKTLSNFKQTVKNIIVAALQAAELLPY